MCDATPQSAQEFHLITPEDIPQGEIPRSFWTFLGKAVVNEQHSDIREFGKGALSANGLKHMVTGCCPLCGEERLIRRSLWVSESIHTEVRKSTV